MNIKDLFDVLFIMANNNWITEKEAIKIINGYFGLKLKGK